MTKHHLMGATNFGTNGLRILEWNMLQNYQEVLLKVKQITVKLHSGKRS